VQLQEVIHCYINLLKPTCYVMHHQFKGGYTLVMLLRTVTLYCDSVDKTHDHVTYQKLVTR
jgi:hypothetical protein